MKKFILLTRLVSEEVHPSFCVKAKADAVKKKVAEFCKDVVWVSNLAILGPWHYVDIFEAESIDSAMKVASIIRSTAGAAHGGVAGAGVEGIQRGDARPLRLREGAPVSGSCVSGLIFSRRRLACDGGPGAGLGGLGRCAAFS